MTVYEDILEWSAPRPIWIQDALRQLAQKGEVDERDTADVLALCKAAHGLGTSTTSSQPLDASHLPVSPPPGSAAVSLVGVHDTSNVNALVDGADLPFGLNGMTIVYGDNGTGKSGYVRILKRICRSRDRDLRLFGNAFTTAAGKPDAVVDYRHGTDPKSCNLGDPSSIATCLSQVSVFDVDAARIYLNERHDVAFVPFGLDLLPRLAELLKLIRDTLRAERSDHQTVLIPEPPSLIKDSPQLAKFLDSLNSETTSADLDSLCARLSREEDAHSGKLKIALDAPNPELAATQIRARLASYEQLAVAIVSSSAVLDSQAILSVETIITDARAAEESLVIARAQLGEAGAVLPISDITAWERLWKAVLDYTHSQHAVDFGADVALWERCPVCQQLLTAEAKNLFSRFASYFKSRAEAEVQERREDLAAALTVLSNLTGLQTDYTPTIDRLEADDPGVGKELAVVIDTLRATRANVAAAIDSPTTSRKLLPVSPDLTRLRGLTRELAGQADAFDAVVGGEAREDLQSEFLGLEVRRWLATIRTELEAEIQRQQTVKRYEKAISEANTQPVTVEAKRLTSKYVTDQLRDSFTSELAELCGNIPKVRLSGEPGEIGVSYYRVELDTSVTDAPAVEHTLSEGEQRAVSLATFMIEVESDPTRSSVVLDDPVGSADVHNRERIATRLVKLATDRQVIVFTHDLFFLAELQRRADDRNVDVTSKMLYQTPAGSGVVADEVPWEAQTLKKRIPNLREEIERTSKPPYSTDARMYETHLVSIVKKMRMAFEKAFEEVLLRKVVQRFERRMMFNNILQIRAMKDSDLEFLHEMWTNYSRFEHEQPPGARTPLPSPDEVTADLDNLEKWRRDYERRVQGL